jgi:serine/threonine-protein kinase
MVQPAQAARVRLPDLEKYEVLEEIGHGGMATVYRARDRRLGREVALKVIHPHLRDSTEVAFRFRGEAQAVAKLRHPNIVEVFDVSGEDEQEQYLVVELLRGRTLRKILKDGGELPPEVAVSLAIELLSALSHAHVEGVVHRDVKPENVIVEHVVLEPDGAGEREHERERVRVKLTDFGIAKLLDAQGVTSTGQVLGSPAHMAPEQIEGGDVDARADVFGLGVLLYECMVGHLPFEGTNPAQVLRRVLDGTYASAERERPTIGRTWSAILDRALAREPDARFRDANAMRDALTAELTRLGMPAPKAILAEYFDDPAAYVARYDAILVERLAKLGAEARRGGRHVEAAAHTNRALAYAPNDPALLAIASSLGRRESSRRVLRRGVPLLIGTLGCGALGFWGSRAIVKPPRTEAPPSAASGVPIVRPTVVPAVVPPTSISAAVAAPRPAPPVVKPTPAPVAVPKPAERSLVFRSLRPAYGVTLTLDNEPVARPSAGMKLTVTRDAHTLKLTCDKDACEPDVRTIAAGEEDEVLDVALAIRAATLVVDGEDNERFQLREEPTIVFGPREVVRVPMKGAITTMHVVDLSSPDRVEEVKLSAGKQSRVTFGSTP